MNTPQDVGGLRYTDHSTTNGLLCDFATRWRIDGDYIRCGTCDRPQLSSYGDNDFPHAAFCRDKNSPTMERRPWQTYIALITTLRAAGSGEGEWDAAGSATLLRSMVRNYHDGHLWDHLDAKACTEAADHIDRLRKLAHGGGAGDGSLRAVAKRNLRSLINIGSDDKALMLKCLEELS